MSVTNPSKEKEGLNFVPIFLYKDIFPSNVPINKSKSLSPSISPKVGTTDKSPLIPAKLSVTRSNIGEAVVPIFLK